MMTVMKILPQIIPAPIGRLRKSYYPISMFIKEGGPHGIQREETR
jgi:hypothetical protein